MKLSNNVLAFRQKPVKGTQKRICPTGPRWHCLSCESDTFKLYEDGTIHCAVCTSRIRNIETRPV